MIFGGARRFGSLLVRAHGRAVGLLATVLGLLVFGAFALAGQAAASSPQTVLGSSTCSALLGGKWHSGTCTLSSSATLQSSQKLTIPHGVTLSITYGASDDSAGLIANGTILNNGTISIAYSGAGGEGLLSSGSLTNDGKITIND